MMTMQTLYQDTLAAICPDPIIAVDRAGIVVFFNQAAEQLLEYRAEEVVGKLNIQQFYHPGHAGREVKRLMHANGQGGRGRLRGHESALITKSGRVVPIQISASLIMEQGAETGSVGFFHDLSPRKQLEESLRQLSITDNLTGLYNQRHFYTVLEQELMRSSRYQHPLTLVCVDMDRFKRVNDSLGHQAGDGLIATLGTLIREELRGSDFGFRYGGDEFMILLPETGLPKCRAMAERLQRRYQQEAPRSLAELSSQLPPLSLSIGVVDYCPEESLKQFIRRADQAMYRAKHAGGDRIMLESWQEPPRSDSDLAAR